MIEQKQVDEVRRLLATGKFSQRQVAKMTEVSRGTVHNIAHGKRTDRVPMLQPEKWGPFEGPIQRCPGCGGRVHMPCRLCKARRYALKNPNPNHSMLENKNATPLGLDLEGECLKRYEAIHQKRLLQGEYVEELEEESDGFLPRTYCSSILKSEQILEESELEELWNKSQLDDEWAYS